MLARSGETLATQGAERAAGVAREEIEEVLPHLEPGHRQQLAVAVQRSLQKILLVEAV